MKKFMALILVALMVVPFGMLATTSVSAADTVLYVKEGGTGNGSSADNALPSIDAANQAAAALSTDVTIKFVGTVTLDGTAFTDYQYAEPTHANKITWAGADASAKLIIKTGTSARFYMLGGELCIKDLAIEMDGTKVLAIITNLHDFTVEEGVTCVNAQSAADTITIYGVNRQSVGGVLIETWKNNPYFDEATKSHKVNPNITIKSGSFKQVVGYIANASNTILGECKLDGKVTITISGADTKIHQVYPVCNSYNTVKDCDIILDGGIYGAYVCAVDRAYQGGITVQGPAGVTGNYTVYLTKNFDLSAQTAFVGLSGGAFYGICGTTANKTFEGALDDDGLGKFVLKADAEIYDAVNAETVKINKGTFDEVVKVEAPAQGGNQGGNDNQGGDNTQGGGNADTSDMTWVVAAVAAVSVMGCAVVATKKRATK